MVKSVIKRDGSVEEFSPAKINGWGEWAAMNLGPNVDWGTVVMNTVTGLPEQVTTDLLQRELIKNCLYEDSWLYNRMAGRLYVSLLYKQAFGGDIPSVKELHSSLVDLGFMEDLGYSDAEYALVEELIDHSRDYSYAHYQLHTHATKYAIRDRSSDLLFETSQFMYMRMAMALAVDQPHDRRMSDVKKFYEFLSTNKLNAPTPNHVNLGTPLRGYASCVLYTTDDSARSIGTGNHIAYTMTYMSAGIGSHMGVRSLNDPVRGGVVRHQGKLPYFRAVVGEVRSSLQNGRGGACTSYFSGFDPEVDVLLRLKNPMSTEDRKIRGMDYSWGYNRFFARKVARNEDVFLFNAFTAPDLYAALYSGDEDLFADLYSKYESDPSFVKMFVNARNLFITADNEWNETGRIYEHNIDEMNVHTPFKDTIYSSNLCQEVALPTSPYKDVKDLYATTDISTEGYSPEVATCNLAGIVVSNIDSEEEYEEVAYYALLMIDKCIHLAHYELPHVGVTSKARLNAGVGILGLAHLMAKSGHKFTDRFGKKFIHEVGERHYYYLLKASLRLGRELGNAPWISKTKWPEGWLPTDTYNRHVDEIGDFDLLYDWESLRGEIIVNGGIRNSVLVAHMPTETSANASGTTNGVYPVRELTMIKTDNERVNYWAAPDGELFEYQSAWDIPTSDMIELYALLQKWTDQGISADFYREVIGDASIDSSEMIRDFLYRVKMGLKGKYYMNQRTSSGFDQRRVEVVPVGDDVVLDGECVGACTL